MAQKSEPGQLQLNVDVLAKDVLKFLQQLKTDIAADGESAIAVRMDSRLTQLNHEDHREAEELNREYQRQKVSRNKV